MKSMRCAIWPAIIMTAALLGGCGIFGKQVNMELTEADKQQCPKVGIVAYTGQVTRFAPGGGRTQEDVAFVAQISNLEVTCQDYESETGLRAIIGFDVSASRGSAATSSSLDLPYFVVVTKGSETVLSRKNYTTYLSISSTRGRAVTREYVSAAVPFDTLGKVVDEEILIGFQLSRDEIAYNVNRY